MPAPSVCSPASRLIAPTIAAIIVFALLCSLGAWQWRRLHWKEALIAQVNGRIHDAPVAAPGPSDWPKLDLAAFDYTPVSVSGSFLNDREAYLYGSLSEPRGPVGGVGWWVFTPFRTDAGWIVYVNRGFVPDANRLPAKRLAGQIEGHVTVTGLLRRPERPSHWFGDGISRDDQWFAREPSLFARASGLPAAEVAPYSIDADATPNIGGLPQGGETTIIFPNNHLQYVVTWFGLAFALVAVFIAYARGVLRGRR
ncbi:SURF1 family protein [Kaistia dalseonensis]|uniref:SURF1-like protein n=1 Tax=Kaistia dalseonensis TaxID=410840 RepID=A0ABU0HCT1_9HYPH|nr:SURF1 family protein [Kaistia dalseonensis]MCX5497446.1 SURF1 family protein [Kaistia dalseonensis]MDQ0440085.1 surfeit locus 1 family protein [Kaistia dalseonensis]